MCGISGSVSSVKPDLNILKLLSIYNRERGKHSCGVAINDRLTKGVKEKKGDYSDSLDFCRYFEFTNFSKGDKPFDNNTTLWHTRYATMGAHTKHNAHPFRLETDKEDVFLIGAHNGSLYNMEEFNKKYNIDTKVQNMDSKQLLSALAKNRNNMEEVLKDYNGAAALCFYFTDEPNTLYLWKGTSKNEKGVVEPERPLYYIINEDVVYFSSLYFPLTTTTNHAIDAQEVADNTLMKFEGNQIVSTVVVDRTEKCYKKPIINRYADVYRGYANFKKQNAKVKSLPSKKDKPKEVNPQRFSKGNFYYYNGKIWRNGHLVEGLFFVDPVTGDYTGMEKYRNEGQEELFFYQGIPFKNADFIEMNKNLAEGELPKLHDIAHYCKKDFLLKSSEFSSYYYGGRRTSNTLVIRPYLSVYSFYINSSSELQNSFFKEPKKEVEEFENFNNDWVPLAPNTLEIEDLPFDDPYFNFTQDTEFEDVFDKLERQIDGVLDEYSLVSKEINKDKYKALELFKAYRDDDEFAESINDFFSPVKEY